MDTPELLQKGVRQHQSSGLSGEQPGSVYQQRARASDNDMGHELLLASGGRLGRWQRLLRDSSASGR